MLGFAARPSALACGDSEELGAINHAGSCCLVVITVAIMALLYRWLEPKV
jgi:hypothetical protein